MGQVATGKFPADQRSGPGADALEIVLDEICEQGGFGPHSEARSQIAIYLERLFANGYFTVEGLRQAFVAHVARRASLLEPQG